MEIMFLLSVLLSLVSIVCWIIILIKLFNFEGVGKGIFGIICGLYAFIWGWQKADAHNHKNIMIIWSICAVVNIILSFTSQ